MIDPKEYRPLPGRMRGPLYSFRLYGGRDHLLKSSVQGFHEHFRRFAWTDIQAFVIEATPWGAVLSVLLLVSFLMVLISYLTFDDKSRAITITYAIIAAPLLVLGAINFRLGPTCKCYVQTAVTRERLWCLNRLRTARHFVEVVAPTVLERQPVQAPSRAEPSGAGPASAPSAEPEIPPAQAVG